ncbi:T9SS type A sorting domain-containing protein [Algoriphagus algorifonticola]|uniref:T9SS type A sorting domain-containing protein n=1 Tax=Algoriphagus algorifonticola TaxID=2593007 RepID=UPI00119D03BA|nr:T9SS type A sorting domain-containing protein [Algoriphagus algorifonticola]
MKPLRFLFFLAFLIFSGSFVRVAEPTFRVKPYLQVFQDGKVQITWFTSSDAASEIKVFDELGTLVLSQTINGEEVPEIFYTSQELNQSIDGLDKGSWLYQAQVFRFRIQLTNLKTNHTYRYQVIRNGAVFESNFTTAPDKSNWENIRFIALSDSETEPLGRVNRRAWFPRDLSYRPSANSSKWKDKFGVTVEQGIPILNYALTEKEGYAHNLKIINSRNPNFIVMPGDLVQGGGYQPAWDEFWRHNAGDFDNGLSKYPIIPALGNWENFGGISGGYGNNENGQFAPVVGRKRFHAYFETPSTDPLQKHRQSYYRVDYGPVTILTLDSSNGTPDQSRSDFPENSRLKNQEYTVDGTDTQENFTASQYAAAGGTDLSGFGPDSEQYVWLEANLKSAKEAGQLIFVQFHHIPFSSGEHGVPMNHELATGQGGTPLRVLHPLFEANGVIAVLAGHDELFERSLVDLDGDGKGVLYYDVGVAGDGMRGEKRNWLRNPLELLNYNPYKKWTADQNEPEQWDTSGSTPLLKDGGKHYGHLEVNLKKIQDGGKTFAQIDFDPVYAFPVLNSNYDLERVERRVYGDSFRVMVELSQSSEVIAPQFKEKITVELNENGIANTKAQDYFNNSIQDNWTITFSRDINFSCADLAGTEVEIQVKDDKGNTWTKVVLVSVLDKIPPKLVGKTPTPKLDLILGKLELIAEDFIASAFDNCGEIRYELSKQSFTCEDVGKKHVVKIFGIDSSGNQSFIEVEFELQSFQSKDLSISPVSGTQIPFGQQKLVTLGNEFDYEVLAWYYNEEVIPNQFGKSIEVSKPGQYFAKVKPLPNGCPIFSKKTSLTQGNDPFAGIKKEIILILNPNGIAELGPKSLFDNWTTELEKYTYIFSKDRFTCENIGTNEINLEIKSGNDLVAEYTIIVVVKDTLAPVLTVKESFQLEIKLETGKGILKTSDLVIEARDICSITSLTVSRSEFGCEDIGKTIPVKVTAKDPSGNTKEATTQVKVVGVETARPKIVGNQALCEGATGVLEIESSQDFEVLKWFRNDQELVGEKNKKLEIQEGGKYQAVIRYVGACLSESLPLEVSLKENPGGEIKVDGDILRAPEGMASYQWFKDGEKIPEATQRELKVTTMGTYKVQVTNEAGCTAMLKEVVMTIAGLPGGKLLVDNLKVYPNPAKNHVKLIAESDLELDSKTVSIFDLSGKNVSQQIILVSANLSEINLDVSLLPSGTYTIIVLDIDQKVLIGKLIKLD